ncbi:uncharacterized protein F4822DRAFT_435496 [Hypoxylon trugodes]|uniref:uncharacterized protein n=1 Tax=Hypoxylon trugodes TaxID=326681 RepID=UPI00219EB26B|nr:uncharacterized protein F4822DRAFT_435496 [Hypoxylon trugodes]KAI1382518.1 hypothetical protein F4822DRAFT_435496 [Hypoxylon trugodes]
MAVQKLSDKRHKKMLRRNLEGLLSKIYKYGNLRGVELGLYVNYIEKNEFVSYETGGFFREEIEEKKSHPNARNYTPEDKRLLQLMEKMNSIGKTGSETRRDSESEKGIEAFPEFPDFQLTLFIS